MPADPPPEFVDELGAAFGRLVPKGSPGWALTSNLGRLRRALVGGVGLAPPTTDELPGGRPAATTAAERLHGALGSGADRWAAPWVAHQARVAARGVVERAVGGALGVVGEALDAASESLRFLTARVDRLEEAASRRRRPVDSVEWLVGPPDLGRWSGTVQAWLGAPSGGEVVVAECGDGALPAHLVAAGWRVRAAEPRAPVALLAARRGLDVQVATAAELVASIAPGGASAVVLAGAVDRGPLDDVVGLAETAVDRLVSGGALVVLAEGTATWEGPALDLLPGRPLRAETWELVLRRLGCTDVRSVTSADAGLAGADGWAVVGRR